MTLWGHVLICSGQVLSARHHAGCAVSPAMTLQRLPLFPTKLTSRECWTTPSTVGENGSTWGCTETRELRSLISFLRGPPSLWDSEPGPGKAFCCGAGWCLMLTHLIAGLQVLEGGCRRPQPPTGKGGKCCIVHGCVCVVLGARAGQGPICKTTLRDRNIFH